MKIKRLMVENLTSLRGRHEIDFQNDLSGADLFAITGPTGSGKSSLLNAISLALYARSAKSELSSQDFVSTGADQARVHLEFSHMTSLYLATWSFRRLGKTGKALKSPKGKREFFRYDPEKKDWLPLENSPEDILQLTYAQFTRSVVLNQGEFAQFLTSSFSERRQILERIYSGENLQALKTILNEKLKNTKTEKEIIDQKDQGLMPFSEEHYLDLKEQYTEHKKEDERLMAAAKLVQNLSTEFKRLWETLEQHLNTELKLKKLETQFSDQTEQVNQNKRLKSEAERQLEASIKRYKEQRPLLEKLQQTTLELNRQKQLYTEVCLRIEQYQKSEDDKKVQLKNIQADHHQLNLQIQDIKKELPQNIAQAQLETLESMSSQLRSFLKIGHELKDHYQSQAQELRLTEKEIQLKDKQLVQVKEERQRSRALVQQLEHTQKQLMHPYKTLEELNKRWQNAQVDFKNLEQKEKELLELNQGLQNTQDQLKETKIKSSSLEHQLKELDEEIHQIEKWKELNELQASLENCIKQSLQDGECYVCGHEVTQKILEHPMLKNNYSPDLIKLKQLQQQRQQKQKDLDWHKVQEQDLNKKSQQYDIDLKASKKSLTQVCEAWGLDQSKNGQSKAEGHVKESMSGAFKTIISELEQLISKAHQNQQKTDQAQAKSDESHQTLLNLEKELNQRKQSQLNLQQKQEQTKEKMRQEKKQIDSLALPKDHTIDDYEEIHTLIKDLLLKEANLKQLSSYAQQAQKDLNNFKESREKEKSSKAQYEKALRELNEQNQATLQEIKLTPSSTPGGQILDLVETKMKELEKESEQNQTKLNEHTQNLQSVELQQNQTRGQLSLQKERLKELRDLFDVHRTNFVNQLDELKTQGDQTELNANWQAKFSNLELENITDEQKDALKAFEEDKLLALLEKTQAQLNRAKEKIQEAKAQIELYESRLKQRKDLLKQTNELNKKIESLEKLHSLIGKDEFRDFALAMIERDLIRQTNLELEKICQGRYRIDFAITSRAQEFSLIDYWQGAQQRKISTLSGGETFLVSLAMALSLAEMSRGATEINSFFIDEGFGSLDQDSLEEVIETLSHIRSRGKQIGIISHVKELTQRIDINIDLMKNQHGESQIQLLYN